MATPAQPQLMTPLHRSTYADLGIERGPVTPERVYARIVDGRTLYVNTTGDLQEVGPGVCGRGVLSGLPVDGSLRLAPWAVELIE